MSRNESFQEGLVTILCLTVATVKERGMEEVVTSLG